MKSKFVGLMIAALMALAVPFNSAIGQSRVSSVNILNAATATGAGEVMQPVCQNRTFQAYGATSAGAGAATIVIEASDLESPVTSTRVDWVVLGTITLTLATTRTSDGFVSEARWRHVRAYVTAISGTNATVSAFLGC